MLVRQIISNALRFVFLVLLQVLILDKVYLGGYINPYLYIYFILALPFIIPGWLLLLLAFLLGISIDSFNNSYGIHTSATLLMAFFRPFIIRAMASSEDAPAPGTRPSIKMKGFKWYLYYSIILIAIHHFTLFFIEIFRFSEFFSTFFRAVLSITFTMLLVVISEYLGTGRTKK